MKTDKLSPLQWFAILILCIGLSLIPERTTAAGLLFLTALLVIWLDRWY